MKWRPLITAVLLTGLLLFCSACGKKARPFLPDKKVFSAKVAHLSGEWTEGYVVLKGDIETPGGNKGDKDGVEACRVYYGQYPLENPPCETCPIKYQGYHVFGPEVVRDGGFFCKVPGKVKGEIYFFKVHLIGKDGTEGPPSDRVKIAVK
ncbi:MAG: hypothetical protein ABII06_08405 [Pseudomonadota bacterium]